jgi:hypothetical protein
MKALRQSLDPRTQDVEARLRGLRNLARKIFLDRNAQGWNRPGMPKGDRLAIKVAARPFLRLAIHWARKSRDALLSGDVQMHELLRDRARMNSAFAALEFFQPYANQLGEKYIEFAAFSSRGGKAKAETAEREKAEALAELDGLIRGCINDDRPFRVREWIEAFPIKRSALYVRIQRIKCPDRDWT